MSLFRLIKSIHWTSLVAVAFVPILLAMPPEAVHAAPAALAAPQAEWPGAGYYGSCSGGEYQLYLDFTQAQTYFFRWGYGEYVEGFGWRPQLGLLQLTGDYRDIGLPYLTLTDAWFYFDTAGRTYDYRNYGGFGPWHGRAATVVGRNDLTPPEPGHGLYSFFQIFTTTGTVTSYYAHGTYSGSCPFTGWPALPLDDTEEGVSVEILDGPEGNPLSALRLDEVTGDLTPNPLTVKVSLNDSLPDGARRLDFTLGSATNPIPFAVSDSTFPFSQCNTYGNSRDGQIYTFYSVNCVVQVYSPNTDFRVTINVLPSSMATMLRASATSYNMDNALLGSAEALLDVPVSVYPVIFVPGFGGTELRTTLENPEGWVDPYALIWLNYLDMLQSPDDGFLDIMRLADDGINPYRDDCASDGPYCALHTTEVMLKVPGVLGAVESVYQPLADYLTTGMQADFAGSPYVLGSVSRDGLVEDYVPGQNLWLFPTDFRKDMVITAEDLDKFVDSVKAATDLPKVNLVGHSQGGVIMREYISNSVRAAKVDRYITLAAPYLGVPFGFKGLRYGGNFGLRFIGLFDVVNPEKGQEIIQNWPGAYQLMPFNTPYFNATGGYWYVGRDINKADNNPVPPRLLDTRDDMVELLQSEHILDDFESYTVDNYNKELLRKAVDFQDDNIRDWASSWAQNVERHVFVGTGKCTDNFYYEYMRDGHPHLVIIPTNGDSSVPIFSGDMLHSIGGSDDVSDNVPIYYANNLFHGPPGDDVPTDSNVLKSVVSILRTGAPIIDGENLSRTVSSYAHCDSIESLSPVEIHVTDGEGRHTGPLPDNQGSEMSIPDSQFHLLPYNQIAFVPSGGPYAVSIAGTGTGTFALRIRQWQDSTVIRSILYSDVPVNPSTQARLSYTTGSNMPVMEVDEDGDGVYELSITPTSIDEPHAFDVLSPVTTIHEDGILGIDGAYVSSVTVTLSASDNADGVGLLKTEYSLDGGSTFQTYDEPFVIDQDGLTTVMARSTDREGNREEPPMVAVIRIDKTAPVLTLSVDPTVLWPANHKLVVIYPTVQVHDAFDPAPIVRLVSVTSNEPDDGLGDGDTAGDIVIQPDGTILLRAERSGRGQGRVYTITYSAQDASGNVTVRSVAVIAPKDRLGTSKIN